MKINFLGYLQISIKSGINGVRKNLTLACRRLFVRLSVSLPFPDHPDSHFRRNRMSSDRKSLDRKSVLECLRQQVSRLSSAEIRSTIQFAEFRILRDFPKKERIFFENQRVRMRTEANLIQILSLKSINWS